MTRIVASGRFIVRKRGGSLPGWVVEDLFSGTIMLITSDRKEAERAADELEDRNPMITNLGPSSDESDE